MAARQVRGGVEVDGLSEAINALGRIDKRLKKEAVGIMRDSAKEVQALAQSNIGKGQYRGPTNKGMIGRSATSTGAGIRLRASKYPWAYKAEFGERVHHVYSHPWRQINLQRRTANRHSPPTSADLFRNRGGYMIQPAIRKLAPKSTRDAQLKMLQLFRRHLGNDG